MVDRKHKKEATADSQEEEDLRKGNLFATGLVAGGALAGVIVAFLSVNEGIRARLNKINLEHALSESLGQNGYYLLGTAAFLAMAYTLLRIGLKKEEHP
jgi:hypothetical protein